MDLVKRIPYYGLWLLMIYMPFHIFLSQWLSLGTGGLEVWKVGKDVVLAVLVLFTICLVWQQRRGDKYFWGLVGFTAFYGLLHLGVWLLNSDIYTRSALIGFVYNMRLPVYLVLGYGALLLYTAKFVFSSLFKVIVGLGALVALLGIVQYFLPPDVMTHFGYGLERGTRAAFFIDDNPALPRVMSTLREPNALGAYLLVPVSMTLVVIGRVRTVSRRVLLLLVFGVQIVALFLTFSRSAWLAAAVTLVLVAWFQYRALLLRSFRKFWIVFALSVLLLFGILIAERNAPFVQHFVAHKTQEVVQDLDSNDYHSLFIEQGLRGVANQPWGHGPGTAGLASIQNPGGGQLTENYYVQIAYELGAIGLVLFVLLNVFVYVRLRAIGNSVSAVLLASFWGYVIMNMLLHTWSNEAVAAQWWLATGLVLGVGVVEARRARSASTKPNADA